MMTDSKLTKAKAKLMMENPYFGMMSSYLEVKSSDNIESFLSDGNRLEINETYLANLSLEETQFVLSNAAMHRVLDHQQRQDSKMTWLWQLATDYAINGMLVNNGLPLPDRVNYDTRFEGKYAEEIYAILKDEIRNEAYDQNEANESGYNENNQQKQNEMQAPQDQSEGKREQLEGDAMQALIEAQHKEAIKKADQASKEPKDLARLISKRYVSDRDWRALLADYLQEHLYSDYTRFPANKKLLYQGVYLPAPSHTPAKLGIAIDSSASISQTLLDQFVAEIEAIRLELQGIDIELFVVDAKVHAHHTFYEGEMVEVEILGGGGTDFRALFDYVLDQEIQIDCLLYFTDGAGIFPDDEPDFDLLWALTQATPIPFGETIILDAL